MLDVHRLTVRFRLYAGVLRRVERSCLRGVSLTAPAGRVTAVIGASGAGKSLLAHAILGLLPSNAVAEGVIRFEGDPLDEARLRHLRGRRIALVPQPVTCLDALVPVGRQIAWAARRAGVPARQCRAAAAAALGRLGLGAGVHEVYPHVLSAGMARRVLLAAATVADPDLVVADEPTAGLDEENADAVLGHLRGLADQGKAVVVITHDIVAAVRWADDVAVLDEGELVGLERPEDFAGDGRKLRASYSRRLWRALPQNGLHAGLGHSPPRLKGFGDERMLQLVQSGAHSDRPDGSVRQESALEGRR